MRSLRPSLNQMVAYDLLRARWCRRRLHRARSAAASCACFLDAALVTLGLPREEPHLLVAALYAAAQCLDAARQLRRG